MVMRYERSGVCNVFLFLVSCTETPCISNGTSYLGGLAMQVKGLLDMQYPISKNLFFSWIISIRIAGWPYGEFSTPAKTAVFLADYRFITL